MTSAAHIACQIVLLGVLLALTPDELLRVQVLLVYASIVATEQAIVHLGLHLGFFARDDIWVGRIGNLLISSSRLMRMLTLRSLRDILQNVSLDLHTVALIAMIGDLD